MKKNLWDQGTVETVLGKIFNSNVGNVNIGT